MKVFWSWQSDTPGKTGRHLIRGALIEAIEKLKEQAEVEEPSEREARDALHLDHDRQGVSGSPDLAPTILAKIDQSSVFVADMTLVGQVQALSENRAEDTPKKLVNSNVAIEYGYALKGLTDRRILMVQNVHYGDRDELPFDLKHKAGPIQFRLELNASREEIQTELAKLRGAFIEHLRPFLAHSSGPTVPFEETPCTTNKAFFWNPGESLASFAHDTGPFGRETKRIEYRFDAPTVFYLRLLPAKRQAEPLDRTRLMDTARSRVQLLTRIYPSGPTTRNRFGAICYSARAESAELFAFTQLFPNGEIWGVTKDFISTFYEIRQIVMGNLQNAFERVLSTFVEAAGLDLGIAPPYDVELGAVGLDGLPVGSNQRNVFDNVSEPIREDTLCVRKTLATGTRAEQAKVVQEFLRRLYDLAGIAV